MRAGPGDGTRIACDGRAAPTLDGLSGQVVRLRFPLTRARLFAFWVESVGAGESRGYLAAGGPGLSTGGDAG